MARTSSIPEEIQKYKPCKCSKIRKDDNAYRVYKYKAVKLPSGKWGTDSGYLIGKIVPDVGFIPNKRYLKELEAVGKLPFSDEITDVSYGQYALLQYLSKDVIEKLKACFPIERAFQIYSYALVLCANGFVHVDQVDDIYQVSFLSVQYAGMSFKMGSTALSGLLTDLGSKTNPISKFEQMLIDEGSKEIAIDGHVIRSCSTENDLGEPGYKVSSLKSPQVNLLIAFDVKMNQPLMYRTYRGSSVDKKSCVDFLESRNFTDTKFLVDRGFYSEKILDFMSSNGNTYIIPVPGGNKHFKRIKKTLEYTSGEFIYKSGPKSSARIMFYEEQIDENTRIIFYKDIDENNSKRKSYQQLMAAEERNYTQENYDKYCEWWGVYVLQTNTTESASDVYNDYKKRWSIETFNNYIKNDADFNDLKLQDYYSVHGFDFIMLVTGLIHARLNEAVKQLNKPSISTYDILLKAGKMRMLKEDNVWHLRNTRTRDIDLLGELGFTPDRSFHKN